LRKDRPVGAFHLVAIEVAIGVQEGEDQPLHLMRLWVLAVEQEPLAAERTLKSARLVVGRDNGQAEDVLGGNVTQVALAEVLALVDHETQPGVLALELPFPGDRLAPEPLELLGPCSLRLAGAAPAADQVVEGLQGLPRALPLWTVGGTDGERNQKDQKRQSGAEAVHEQSLSREEAAKRHSSRINRAPPGGLRFRSMLPLGVDEYGDGFLTEGRSDC